MSRARVCACASRACTRTCRALQALAEERRKNQALGQRLEQLQGELAEIGQRVVRTQSGRLAPVKTAAPHSVATPRRGWGLLNMIREASGGNQSPPGAHASPPGVRAGDVDEMDGGDWSPTYGNRRDVVVQLAQTKVSLAQVEGKLAEARRDVSRLKDVNNALSSRVESLTEERDKSWQDVRAPT
jgi:hypothetical protein